MDSIKQFLIGEAEEISLWFWPAFTALRKFDEWMWVSDWFGTQEQKGTFVCWTGSVLFTALFFAWLVLKH